VSDTVELEAAAIEAKAARERLIATSHELRARLDPATLINEARTGVRHKAGELADNAGEAARRRPEITAAAAALALLFVLRRPLRRVRRRLFGRKETTGARHR
jgi:hypothetical protein